jgi:uncharacterized protein (TIGR04255 family)
MRPDFDLVAIEPDVRAAFTAAYPVVENMYVDQFQIERKPEAGPELSLKNQHGLLAFLFRAEDRRQIVQARSQGYSFNRLAPYSSLDDYLGEIERTWSFYSSVAKPLSVFRIKLRYINRVLLPLEDDGVVDLDQYFKVGPKVPKEPSGLALTGFTNRTVAVDQATGHQATMVLASQPEEKENNRLPVIFDIGVVANVEANPSNWEEIKSSVSSLRKLKNNVFEHTLKEKCLELFS